MSDWLTRRSRLQLCQRAVCTSTRLVTAMAFCDQVEANHCSLSCTACLPAAERRHTQKQSVLHTRTPTGIKQRWTELPPRLFNPTHTHTTAHCQSTAATHFNEFLLYNLAHMSPSVCTWGSVSALQIRRVRKLTAELLFLSLGSNWNTPTVTIHPMTCQGFSFFFLNC